MKSKVQIECRFNYNQSQYNINTDIYLNAHEIPSSGRLIIKRLDSPII